MQETRFFLSSKQLNQLSQDLSLKTTQMQQVCPVFTAFKGTLHKSIW